MPKPKKEKAITNEELARMIARGFRDMATKQDLERVDGDINSLRADESPRSRLHLVPLPDLSASIEPRAEEDALKAMSQAAASMQRGDSIAVIPIAADADNDDQGRVLRWQLAERSEPFDGDLLHLERQEQGELQMLFERTIKRPCRSTDVLGAPCISPSRNLPRTRRRHSRQSRFQATSSRMTSSTISGETSGCETRRPRASSLYRCRGAPRTSPASWSISAACQAPT